VINSNIRGPAVIGDNTTIEESYVGPYSAIGKGCTISGSEVEYSIIMDGCQINQVKRRIESSLLGNDVEILRSKARPATHRFMLGDQSRVEIE
jgi:glucose-1-phosphate thymidylyltransferase